MILDSKHGKCWFKCDICGKFIPHEDLSSGDASHQMITPESIVTHETFRTLCWKHNYLKEAATC